MDVTAIGFVSYSIIRVNMGDTNYFIIILVLIAAVALVVFLMVRNRRDRKKYINPTDTDPVEGDKMDHERDRDRI